MHPVSIEVDDEAVREAATVVFATDHVVVRPYSLRAFPDLQRVVAVPELHRNLFLGLPMTHARVSAIIRYERRQWIRTGAAHWMAYRASGELLGVAGFQPCTIEPGWEVDMAMLPEVRHQPDVVRLYRSLLDYGFTVLRQPTLYALSVVGHASARRFGEKEGSVYVRTIEVTPGLHMEHFTITPASVAAARAARPLPDDGPRT